MREPGHLQRVGQARHPEAVLFDDLEGGPFDRVAGPADEPVPAWLQGPAADPAGRVKAPRLPWAGAPPKWPAMTSFPIGSIDAALNGDGVALGSLDLLAAPLAEGTLVQLGVARLVTGYGYHLGLPKFRTAPPEALRLHDSLLASRIAP